MQERAMEERIRALEDAVETGDLDVVALLEQYKKEYPRPHWQLVTDIQRQALIHYNIIEALKQGQTPTEIRQRFGAAPELPDDDEHEAPSPTPNREPRLSLVPEAYLPNPNGLALLRTSFEKVGRYRDALIAVVRDHGAPLLAELSFQVGYTTTVSVNVGLPPSVSFGIEYTAQTTPHWA
jgi:hypothetical protein